MNARVADDAEEGPVGRQVRLEGLRAGLPIRDVEREQRGVAAEIPDHGLGLLGLLAPLAVVERNRKSSPRELQRDGAPDAAARARDQHSPCQVRSPELRHPKAESRCSHSPSARSNRLFFDGPRGRQAPWHNLESTPMRVAFVSGNRELLPDAAIPIGILSVIANLPKRHETILIDLCFEDAPAEALAGSLGAFGPDVVALGMRNIQNADYSGTSNTLEYYDGLIGVIRNVTEAPIAIGGSGFSVMPVELMKRLRPDFGISGEAEEAFPALLDRLEAGLGFDEIGNLHRFEGGGVISNGPPSGFLDMNTLSPADRSLADPRYYERFGIESLQTKRGCPLRCDYCTYPIIEGRVGRVRDGEACNAATTALMELHTLGESQAREMIPVTHGGRDEESGILADRLDIKGIGCAVDATAAGAGDAQAVGRHDVSNGRSRLGAGEARDADHRAARSRSEARGDGSITARVAERLPDGDARLPTRSALRADRRPAEPQTRDVGDGRLRLRDNRRQI